ncbi:MAG: DUF3015 domain-containing protein [Gammaproteobacteria bacterium]|nr:DUF3015 domain-containing protein [Gammaproteobacteria bacterium]
MKNKLLVSAATLLLASASAAFADNKNNVGCGVGSMAFDGRTEKHWQVLAVTTNGVLGNQTFGITSGTLGCDPNGMVDSPTSMAYIDSNIDRLARDMSVGEGESLEGLAAVIGIPQDERSAFYVTTHEHFAEIYPTADVTAAQVNANLHAVMARDTKLSQYAQL